MQKEGLIFCENIKKLRKKESLSKKEMAKRLGIGTSSLTMLENGEIPKRLTCKIVYKIQEEFDILPQNMFKRL